MRRQQVTNVLRILRSAGIPHQVLPYEVEEEHLDAATVAARLSRSPDTLFKTLVARDEQGEIRVFCVPGACDLDLKKAARAARVKKIELVGMKELFGLTGYVRGGCSPIGMKRRYPVYLDEIAITFPEICVSAGARGLQVALAPERLLRLCRAVLADLV
jgi:Cys-tRNA(Pro)/Cys-tRNA(Cys) deacylase